jgi:hypothetical protein
VFGGPEAPRRGPHLVVAAFTHILLEVTFDHLEAYRWVFELGCSMGTWE